MVFEPKYRLTLLGDLLGFNRLVESLSFNMTFFHSAATYLCEFLKETHSAHLPKLFVRVRTFPKVR
jgi:hypothetical protein